SKLGIEEHDTLVPGARYHNFRDFMNFPDLGLSKAHYEKMPELRHRGLKRNRRLLDTIRNKDILLHYPYQSFDYVIDLLREASIDPKVSSIRITIYRAGRNSSVINALINAARNGKAVTAILELQARFDEEANLQWGNLLQDEGVRVIYGVPGLKVHSKLILITRRAGNQKFRYAVVGTGNFNEDTARLYTDFALFTADPRITSECHKVFYFYNNNYKIPHFKHLLVSPFNLRKQITRLIRNEIRNAKAGKPAFIHLKLNNLVDADVIRHLYAAGKAGVEVRLIVRSMFSMIVGKENGGNHIEAISIVDKFLEHARLFVFGNAGAPKYFISSADLMPRNLEQRVEVASPIFDPGLQAELATYFNLQWQDNVKARILNGSLDNKYRERSSDKVVRSQWNIYDYLKRIHG
ncbi:MAG TPA: polyphosphate kinase 1, partial [candidate division Zixibacteria bacterium]|nr:polyphosphate kinase 1 [candidate division Zixibacteria bacterium]